MDVDRLVLELRENNTDGEILCEIESSAIGTQKKYVRQQWIEVLNVYNFRRTKTYYLLHLINGVVFVSERDNIITAKEFN